jgi:hypothetical protein
MIVLSCAVNQFFRKTNSSSRGGSNAAYDMHKLWTNRGESADTDMGMLGLEFTKTLAAMNLEKNLE